MADDLASGTLCAPRGFVADGSHYVLMSPRPVQDEASFALVLDWLRAQTLPLGLAHAQAHAQAPAAG